MVGRLMINHVKEVNNMKEGEIIECLCCYLAYCVVCSSFMIRKYRQDFVMNKLKIYRLRCLITTKK